MNDKRTLLIMGDMPIGVPETDGLLALWMRNLYETGLLQREWPDIHWLIFSKKTQRDIHFDTNGQSFHILKQASMRIGQYTGYLHERLAARQLIGKINPSLVHAWGTEHAYALCGSDFKGPKLLSMQGILTAYYERAPLPSFYKLQKFWEKVAVNKYRYISVESPWGRDRILEINPASHVELIEYGTQDMFFDTRKNLSDIPSLFFAGSLSVLKGVDTMVEAFSRPELSHVNLRIAGGSKDDIGKYSAGATPNITFLGHLSREQIARELSSAWSLVHMTRADTSPNIVKEARCSGTAVITTPEGGQTQYVEDGLSGFIVSPGDADTLVEKVLAVTSSPETALTMGEHGRQDCQARLKPELTTEGFLRFYDRILAERH